MCRMRALFCFWNLVFSYQNGVQDNQRVKILLAYRVSWKSEPLAHRISIINCHQRYKSVRGTFIDSQEAWIGRKSKAGSRSNDKKSSPSEMSQTSWAYHLKLCIKLKNEPDCRLKKILTSNRDDKQNKMAWTRSRKLYTTVLTKFDCVVMYNETYVKAQFKQLPEQEFYTSTGRGKVADNLMHMRRSMFGKKYLVWQAVCTCGVKSDIFIATGFINQKIYMNEYLENVCCLS